MDEEETESEDEGISESFTQQRQESKTRILMRLPDRARQTNDLEKNKAEFKEEDDSGNDDGKFTPHELTKIINNGREPDNAATLAQMEVLQKKLLGAQAPKIQAIAKRFLVKENGETDNNLKKNKIMEWAPKAATVS
eukprot:3418892-Ditylum_brightwellii.AAC.1